MKSVIKLIRPLHYIKNILIILPLFFSGRITDTDLLAKTLLAAISFCFISSAIYIINDINDIENDKKHPTKRNRVLASGAISIQSARIILFVLIALCAAVCVIAKFPAKAIIIIAVYFILNLAYSFGLKNIPILDIAILVSGFMLRVLLGSAVTNIEISSWLYLTVLSISFYLALGKRRGELCLKSDETRKVLKYYNYDFLDKNMHVCLTLAIVFYSLWSMDMADVHQYIIWTVPLVILLCFKYSHSIEDHSDGDPIEVIFSDKALLAMISAFAIIVLLIIYVL